MGAFNITAANFELEPWYVVWLNQRPLWSVGYPSGQRGQTVNLLAYAFDGSNPSPTTIQTACLSFSYCVRGSKAHPANPRVRGVIDLKGWLLRNGDLARFDPFQFWQAQSEHALVNLCFRPTAINRWANSNVRRKLNGRDSR